MVFRVFKDALSVDVAHHDMIDTSAGLYASLSWHCFRLWIKDERLMILRDNDLSPVLPCHLSCLYRLNASSLVIFFVSIIICVILFMPQRYVLFPNSPNNSPLFCENQQSTINHQQPSLCAAAPSAHKHSRLCCVGTHEQPHRGESLFARTGPAGQALSPHKSQHPLQFPKFMFNHRLIIAFISIPSICANFIRVSANEVPL